MKNKIKLFWLLVFLLAGLANGCSPKEDKPINIAEDDPEMLAAIAKARGTLPQFWEIFDKREHSESDFSLKGKITDKHGTEFFWLTDIERKDGQLSGIVNNDPDIVKNVKFGQRIPISEADIADWLYMRDGKMVGNYTLRVLFKQMPKEEVAKYKQLLADP